MNYDQLNAALENMDEEDVLDNVEEEQESNDAVDESVPDEKKEGEEGSEESGEGDDEGAGDTDGEEGASGEEPGEPEAGEAEGGDAGMGEGEAETPEGDEEPTADEAKQEKMDGVEMPETTPVTEEVEIKDADDADASGDVDDDNKELALDMEEVGALESYIETLRERAVGDDFRVQMGKTIAMGLDINHGLESFGLDKDFGVESMDDLDTLVDSMQTAVTKHKAAAE